MEIKITWSTLAKQQLKDIGQYVADNFGERTANKSLERIVKKVNSLYVFQKVVLLIKNTRQTVIPYDI